MKRMFPGIQDKIQMLRARIAAIKRWTRYEVSTGLTEREGPFLMGVEEDDHSIHSFELAVRSFAGSREDFDYIAEADPDTVTMLLDFIEELQARVHELEAQQVPNPAEQG